MIFNLQKNNFMARIYFGIVLISILLSTSGCGTNTPSKTPAPAESVVISENEVNLNKAQLQQAQLTLCRLSPTNVDAVITLNGKIDVPPQNLVSVSVPAGGYIRSSVLMEGMHVRKGQSIAVIEDKEIIQMQEDYLLHKTKLGYAQAEVQRQQILVKEGATSDKLFQQAKTEFQTLTILVHSYAEKLRFMGIEPNKINPQRIQRGIEVTAPITGFVSKVFVNVGKYVTPNDVLFEIVNPDDIHLMLHVMEKEVSKLFIGQEVIAHTNTNPNEEHRGKIILIGKDFSDSRMTEVHCHFHDYDPKLLPGMYMNAKVITNSSESYTVPEEAVVEFGANQYLFEQLKEGKFQMKEVTLGERSNGRVEVRNSEQWMNKDIVHQGAYTLLMALKNSGEEE